MTHFSRIVLPQDLNDGAQIYADLAFLRRVNDLKRAPQPLATAKTGLFVAGPRRKELFH